MGEEKKSTRKISKALGGQIKAAGFYRKEGYEIKRLLRHLDGINVLHDLKVVVLSVGMILQQFSREKQGNYYCHPNTKADAIGIAPFYRTSESDEKIIRKPCLYVVRKSVEVLVSTAEAIVDTFSCKGLSYATAGGGMQFFSTDTSAFVKAESVHESKVSLSN